MSHRTEPPWSAPSARTVEERAAIHRFRIERAKTWFKETAKAAPDRLCPICGYEGAFSPVRHKIGTWCPGCDSRPRHRLMRLWLDRHGALAPGLRVLHFAAEGWARAVFETAGCAYETADINGQFDLTLDITAIALPDASRDLVIANHVLEHVDDAKALGEIARILSPGGRAVLSVPIIEGWDETLEAQGHTSPDTRRRLFGDPDHLRFYGRDLRDRIAAAGLSLEEFPALEPDVSTYALNRGERLFIGRKA
ncbi:MAG: methyltransferase domain-containing protein [Pseudomonadota bacterium]